MPASYRASKRFMCVCLYSCPFNCFWPPDPIAIQPRIQPQKQPPAAKPPALKRQSNLPDVKPQFNCQLTYPDSSKSQSNLYDRGQSNLSAKPQLSARPPKQPLLAKPQVRPPKRPPSLVDEGQPPIANGKSSVAISAIRPQRKPPNGIRIQPNTSQPTDVQPPAASQLQIVDQP